MLWTACVTPFKDYGATIDFESFETILRLQEQAGNGVLLLGSTGEGLSLSAQERVEIVQWACSLELSVPLMVNVPSYNLSVALEWVEFCKPYPIEAFLVSSAMYTRPGVCGQIQWFKAIINQGQKKTVLYNHPGRTGVSLSPCVVDALKDDPCFYGIKDSTGNLDSMVSFQQAFPEVRIFCGDDHMMPAVAAEGGVGLISVLSNAFPSLTRRYVEASLKHQQWPSKIWWKAKDILSQASNPIPIKAVLREKGIIRDESVRLPLTQDDLHDRQSIRALMLEFYQEEAGGI